MEFVYLIHLEKPIHGGQQYYVGYTQNLDARLHDHRYTKAGSRLLRQANAANIKWEVVRIWWNGTRKHEAYIKSHRNGYAQFYPICTPDIAPAAVPDIYKYVNIK